MHIHTCPLFYDWTHSHSALAPHPHSALDAWQDRIDATIQHCVCVVQSVSHSLFVYFVYIYMYRVRFARPHSAAADLSLAIYLAVEVQSSPDLGVEVPKSDIKVSMVVCSCMWWCISVIGMRFWLGCLRGIVDGEGLVVPVFAGREVERYVLRLGNRFFCVLFLTISVPQERRCTYFVKCQILGPVTNFIENMLCTYKRTSRAHYIQVPKTGVYWSNIKNKIVYNFRYV